MKKTIFILCAGLFCACSHHTVDPIQEEPVEVRFTMSLEAEILPFHPRTKSFPSAQFPDPSVRSDETEGETETIPYKYMEYVVFAEGETEPVHSNKLDSNTEDFGIYVYDKLLPGKYHVCFIAHSSESITLTDDVCTFPEVGDTFFATEPIEVKPGQDITLGIVLHRIVSRVEFVAKDDVPAEVTNFRIVATDIYNQFNVLTGEADATGLTKTITHTFTPEEKATGVKNSHAFYTLVPTDTKIDQVKLTALSNAETIKQREIPEVPIQKNRIIRYTGTLYTPGIQDATFELDIYQDGQWEESEIELPE